MENSKHLKIDSKVVERSVSKKKEGKRVSKNVVTKKRSKKKKKQKAKRNKNTKRKKKFNERNCICKGHKLNRNKGYKGKIFNRQNCFLPNIIESITNFKKVLNWQRQANRIGNWVKLMGKKKNKSSTEFDDALSALTNATNNGTECAGAPLDEQTANLVSKLRNCSASAAAACDPASLDVTNLEPCKTYLASYLSAFDVSYSWTILHISILTHDPNILDLHDKSTDMRLLRILGISRPVMQLWRSEQCCQDRQDQVQ